MSKQLGRNDLCWCGSKIKYKKCHAAFDEKVEAYRMNGHIVPSHTIIKTPEQIEGMKRSSQINIGILDYVASHIKAGITTEEIDRWVSQITASQGAVAATLGYQGFPKSVCTSVNNQVCHGIPSKDIILKDGDIINVDVSTIYNGYYSDSSRMFCIGKVRPEKEQLVRVVKESVKLGLEQVKPWNFLGDMAQAVHDHIINYGYSMVREIGGHGIGLEFHEDPWVGYVSQKGTEMLLVPGMVFTIEPMVNMGSEEIYVDENDGWTVYTEDGLPSAQWEIMVLVTEDGHEVLTY